MIKVIKEPLEVEVQLGNVALKELKERLVKWDLLEAKVKLEHVVKKVTRVLKQHQNQPWRDHKDRTRYFRPASIRHMS